MMYGKWIPLVLLSLSLLNGCTGSEVAPNNATQTGAAAGALTGAVIGYNTTGHHKGERAAIGAVAGAATGALIGNAIDNNTPPPEDTSGWHE
jgi:uncharacterized protein YcfJ